jgi:uncharacterized protein (TIGR03032 family)
VSDLAPAVAEPAADPLSITSSRTFADWLKRQALSLMFTTYQVGKVFAVGVNAAGRLSLVERSFPRCMGLASANDGQTLWMSSLFQVWRLDNVLPQGELYEGYDRVYLPQSSSITGDLDIHDIGQRKDGSVVFVNSRFSCLSGLSQQRSFSALWKPSFISKLAAEDRCHLNGMALEDGEVRYVTAVSRSDVADGWRDRRLDGGVVIDVRSDEVVCQGLSMPHSPRLYRGRLYLHNSGTGAFGWVDLDQERFEPITFCPGYLRGLAFSGDYAVVGLSRPRHDGRFSGLPLDQTLRQRDAEPRCGVMVIDLRSGDIVEWLTLDGLVSELYDVIALPGCQRPMIIGTKGDEIRRMISFEDRCSP